MAKIHKIEVPWDIEEENAIIYIRAILTVKNIELPACVYAVSPTWAQTFHFDPLNDGDYLKGGETGDGLGTKVAWMSKI